MRIAFFTNHFKTEFFHSLSERLQELGHETFWISSGYTYSKWLTNRGASESKLLNLSAFGPEWMSKKSLNSEEELELHRLEARGGLTINNLILMDRLLSKRPYSYARACLYIAQREIRRFMKDNKIEALFSEATWAWELMSILICRELGGRNYCPATVRIPGQRFGFFEGHTESSLVFIREPSNEDREEARKFLDYFVNEKPRPSYWYNNYGVPKAHADWFKKLLVNLRRKHTDPFEQMQPSPLGLVRQRLTELWHSRRVLHSKIFEPVRLPPRRPYVLYALHQQPEASIDVLGAYFSNQSELVKSLARSVPSTHELYVKEHRHCIGNWPLSFYRTIQQIPGVRLVDPFADSHELILHADLVVSVSGTVAYEAALYGRPAMTVVPMYFGPILLINGVNPYQKSHSEVFDCLCGKRNLDAEDVRQRNIEFLAWVIAQSFEGIISDPRSEAECMLPQNLDRVAQSMNLVLKNQTSQQPEVVVG